MIIYHIFFTSHVMEVADLFWIVMHIWVKQIIKKRNKKVGQGLGSVVELLLSFGGINCSQ